MNAFMYFGFSSHMMRCDFCRFFLVDMENHTIFLLGVEILRDPWLLKEVNGFCIGDVY